MKKDLITRLNEGPIIAQKDIFLQWKEEDIFQQELLFLK
jgi:hypothetical protein